MQKSPTVILLSILLTFGCVSAGLTQDKSQVAAAESRKIIPFGNITLMGSYSKVIGGNDVSGLYVSSYFSPTVRLGPRDFLIPLYNGLYKKQRQIINEEEGGRLYTTIMNHNFSLMQKRVLFDRLTQRASIFASLIYNKETADESFGNGLYDYRDYGATLDYQYTLFKTRDNTGILLYGAKYFFRKYPNYKTLIALSSNTAPEKYEKDQRVWGLISRYTHRVLNKLVATVSYDFLFKHFTDKHTIDSDGILESRKRQDNVHLFRLGLDYKLKKNFFYALNGEIELNNSNQNYNDSNGTPDPGDDTFIPHYYDYNRYEIKPSFTYLFPLTQDKSIAFKLAYAYTLRDYSHRNIQDAQGDYQSETQEDRIYAGFLNIRYPLTPKLSFLINADYAHTTSNMKYEKNYRYDYDLYHLLAGLSYKF